MFIYQAFITITLTIPVSQRGVIARGVKQLSEAAFAEIRMRKRPTMAIATTESSTRTGVSADIGLLIARIGIGAIFIAHGWQKWFQFGITGAAASFEQMGIPLPTVSAWFTAIVELGGGIALILGFGVRLVGVLLAIVSLGALFLVHVQNGIFVADGGFELVLALAVSALSLSLLGSGKFGLDALLRK